MDSLDVELFRTLCEKTLEGKLSWEGTASPERFVAPLGGALAASIVRDRPADVIKMAIVEADDQVVISTTVGQSLASQLHVPFDVAAQVWERARRMALKTDEKVATALEALKKL